MVNKSTENCMISRLSIDILAVENSKASSPENE